MINFQIDEAIFTKIPSFKIGIIYYHDIVISDSPQMLKGRLHFFQETMKTELETTTLDEVNGIKEWREVFRKLGTNPKRHPPSNESLFSRLQKRGPLPPVHSAVDLNNLFSLQYEIPVGIYDSSHLNGDIVLRLGTAKDQYTGLNGRMNSFDKKLVTLDDSGAFGSPFVDSVRTKVTTNTTSAVHIVYLRPSIEIGEAHALLGAMSQMFVQVHGGDSTVHLYHQ